MEKHMELGTGAVAGAGLAKVGTMFAASAVGAAIIAAYHPETRKDTWWRAIGAGVGGVLMGTPACRAASHYVPWLFSGSTVDDLGVISTVLFIVGALFWGLVGMLQSLSNKIRDKGADKVGDKVGL
jgi:hypothetical protein